VAKEPTAAVPEKDSLSIYIHLPWCVKKCPYCDFNSHESSIAGLQDLKYAKALIRDLEFELPRIKNRNISSIFIGGGTPSLFSVASLQLILDSLRTHLKFSEDIEITMEANPGSADANRFRGYREIGVNRLSIGAQSFDNASLQALGRIHDAEETHQAIDMAIEAKFENINIDLMFALPGQTLTGALRDLNTACSQAVSHISWYQLTLEANTIFHKFPPELPDDELIWEMQEQGQGVLADGGFVQYEISAYARPGHHCQHNLNYWHYGDYLGLGAGAHGKLTDRKNNHINRFTRHRLPEAYMARAGGQAVIVEERMIAQRETVLEFMMNVFRLNAGFSPSLFCRQTGLQLSDFQDLLDIAIERNFITQQQQLIKPSRTGLNYLNELLQIFIPADLK
jgi:putative oxygen-independent coproporphyrinogen III oxidase